MNVRFVSWSRTVNVRFVFWSRTMNVRFGRTIQSARGLRLVSQKRNGNVSGRTVQPTRELRPRARIASAQRQRRVPRLCHAVTVPHFIGHQRASQWT